jgi:hypothetical protein
MLVGRSRASTPAGTKGHSGLVDWLRGYAAQHSALLNPPIVCDFDQQLRHFGGNVVFSLDDVIRGGVDLELLGRFVKSQRLTINVQQVGDRFENVVNSQIINRSQVLRCVDFPGTTGFS